MVIRFYGGKIDHQNAANKFLQDENCPALAAANQRDRAVQGAPTQFLDRMKITGIFRAAIADYRPRVDEMAVLPGWVCSFTFGLILCARFTCYDLSNGGRYKSIISRGSNLSALQMDAS